MHLGRIAVVTVSSALLGQCINILTNVGVGTHYLVVWVPDYRNIPGNKRADDLAKQKFTLGAALLEDVHIPLSIF